MWKCVHDVAVLNIIRKLPNQKPWMNIEVRLLLTGSDAAYKAGNKRALRAAWKRAEGLNIQSDAFLTIIMHVRCIYMHKYMSDAFLTIIMHSTCSKDYRRLLTVDLMHLQIEDTLLFKVLLQQQKLVREVCSMLPL